jgi:hypothetical protein
MNSSSFSASVNAIMRDCVADITPTTPEENASRVPLTDEEIHECILSNMEKAWELANSGKDASLEGLLHKYEAS